MLLVVRLLNQHSGLEQTPRQTINPPLVGLAQQTLQRLSLPPHRSLASLNSSNSSQRPVYSAQVERLRSATTTLLQSHYSAPALLLLLQPPRCLVTLVKHSNNKINQLLRSRSVTMQP